MCQKLSKDLSLILTQWIDYLKIQKNFSENTISAYSADLKSFINFLVEYLEAEVNTKKISKVNSAQIRSWLAKRRNNGVSARSNARSISALKNFFKYIEKHHGIKNLEIQNIEIKIKEKKLPKPISFQEIENLIFQMQNNKKSEWLALRDIALLNLLYGCGIRISEALNLKVSDINKYSLKVLGKGKKERIVPMFEAIYNSIQKYIENCPFITNSEDFLFLNRTGSKLCRTTFACTLQFLREKLNLSENITPHAMRHSFATHLLKNGVNIRIIQELLGHKSLSSTEIYTKLQPKELMHKYNQFCLRK